MHCDRMTGGAPQFALTSLPGAMMESIGMMCAITLRRECRTARRTIVQCSEQQMGKA
jgi:hypothetical protein